MNKFIVGRMDGCGEQRNTIDSVSMRCDAMRYVQMISAELSSKEKLGISPVSNKYARWTEALSHFGGRESGLEKKLLLVTLFSGSMQLAIGEEPLSSSVYGAE